VNIREHGNSHQAKILSQIPLLDEFERLAQAHPAQVVIEHWICISRELGSQLLDAFGRLLQTGKVRLWILVAERLIGDYGKSVSQCFREREIVLIHCWKVSPGRARVQHVS
jgi:hypothetical protein